MDSPPSEPDVIADSEYVNYFHRLAASHWSIAAGVSCILLSVNQIIELSIITDQHERIATRP